MNEKIKSALNLAKHVSLTVDLWSDRQMRLFLGVTAHYIDENFLLHSIVIGCHVFEGKHTGENILAKLILILDYYLIKEKIFKIVIDNGSNMVKAIRLATRSDNSDDNYDSEIENQDDDEENEKKLFEKDELDEEAREEEASKKEAETALFNSLRSAVGLDEPENQENKALRDFEALIGRDNEGKIIRCFTHSLQLVLKSGKYW